MYAYIAWNNGPHGVRHTSSHKTRTKNERLETKIFERWYKVQTNCEGSFFIRKDGRKHSLALL